MQDPLGLVGRKIDDKYQNKVIHTVRGIGYMIEAPEKSAVPSRTDEAFEA